MQIILRFVDSFETQKIFWTFLQNWKGIVFFFEHYYVETVKGQF